MSDEAMNPLGDLVDVVAQLEMIQPTRSGKTKEQRRFDKTQLKAAHHGLYVHRDYAAHFFRWGWVSRYLEHGDRVLDVGCGQDLALMNVLSGNMSILPEYYLGVDLNKLSFNGSPKWADVLPEFNFVDDYEKIRPRENKSFNVGICFECVEHMMPADAEKLLLGFYHWLTPEGYLYLSTPVFDGHAALNHCHEYLIDELKDLVEKCGFEVVKRYGTFASKYDILKVLTPEHLKVYEELEGYYGGDVMAITFAPLYPDASRNNLWILKIRND